MNASTPVIGYADVGPRKGGEKEEAVEDGGGFGAVLPFHMVLGKKLLEIDFVKSHVKKDIPGLERVP